MHTTHVFSLVVICLLCCVTGVFADGPQAQPIFDGRSLDGWSGDIEYWRVEDEAIAGEIPAGQSLRRNQFIFFDDDVHDFELELEYRISGDPSANSGIQFRSQPLANGGAAGYQADLDDGAAWLGRIYDEHGRELLVERGTRVSIAPDGRRWVDKFADAAQFVSLPSRNEWNSYHLRASGPHIEVWVNGQLCAVLDDHEQGAAEYAGRLAFQLHSGPGPAKVQFRNIRLKNIGKTEFPKRPATRPQNDDRQTQSPVLWHLRPNPAAPARVENAQAQQLVAGMMLTDGFQAELIAAEPDVHQPIAFAIDERGRLWIAEAFSYPTKQPGGEGKDRILILDDRDGDGSFETKTTFAQGLNLVSGIEVGFGGVWVGAAPEMLFIPDRDRNDQPDGPPQVLLDGFGYQDTHETLNSFTWGPDGWLYGNQGVFNTASIGKPGAVESQRKMLRAGVWRYHPVRHEFEIFAHGGSNQWGLDFNDAGHLFMTHCRSYWGGGGTTYVIRNGHFWNQTNAEHASFVSNSAPEAIPHLVNYLPASAKYDSGEGGAGKPGTTAVYGGHSHVGTMIYLGDNWPAIYRDKLFTHNLHGNRLTSGKAQPTKPFMPASI
jgi:putative membrane-bound dehydrogenase-like protein